MFAYIRYSLISCALLVMPAYGALKKPAIQKKPIIGQNVAIRPGQKSAANMPAKFASLAPEYLQMPAHKDIDAARASFKKYIADWEANNNHAQGYTWATADFVTKPAIIRDWLENYVGKKASGAAMLDLNANQRTKLRSAFEMVAAYYAQKPAANDSFETFVKKTSPLSGVYAFIEEQLGGKNSLEFEWFKYLGTQWLGTLEQAEKREAQAKIQPKAPQKPIAKAQAAKPAMRPAQKAKPVIAQPALKPAVSAAALRAVAQRNPVLVKKVAPAGAPKVLQQAAAQARPMVKPKIQAQPTVKPIQQQAAVLPQVSLQGLPPKAQQLLQEYQGLAKEYDTLARGIFYGPEIQALVKRVTQQQQRITSLQQKLEAVYNKLEGLNNLAIDWQLQVFVDYKKQAIVQSPIVKMLNQVFPKEQ